MKAVASAVGLFLAMASGGTMAADPAPYAFGPLRLGMALEDFRQATPTTADQKIFCTGDKADPQIEMPQVFPLTPEMAAAGAVRCAFFGREADGKMRPLQADLADVPATFWALFFSEGKGSPHRLVQINLWIPTPAYGGVVDLFRSRYGFPVTQHAKATIWDNGPSEIVASFEDPTDASAPIFFIHKALQQTFAKRVAPPKDSKPKKK
ncbi:MAG: hypothetical protein H7841_01425 [Magnetospirillum sp. WYHS-4]